MELPVVILAVASYANINISGIRTELSLCNLENGDCCSAQGVAVDIETVSVLFAQEEFCGFPDDDIRRVSKRSSAVGVLRDNLLKRSQPATRVRPANAAQHVEKRRTVGDADAKTVSPQSPCDKIASPLSSPQSDSSPPRGSMKGNIKVRLMLGRYKLLPTVKEKQSSKTVLGGVIRTNATVSRAAAAVKEKRKRRRLSSGQSDNSSVSSSGESDVKYSLSAVAAGTVPRRHRPALHPSAMIRARARQLVSKARVIPPTEKKPTIASRPWAPFWHGKLQLPTQSSRSSRKITINRRFLDDSYTSIGQPGLMQQKENVQTVTQIRRSSSKQDVGSSAESRVRGVAVLNRPLGARPAVKRWRQLQAKPDKTAVVARSRVRQAKSLSESASASRKTKSTSDIAAADHSDDNDDDESEISDKQVDAVKKLSEAERTWWLPIVNSYKSIYSNHAKKGSMVGKSCTICCNVYMVHHHYMSRVPCCRACARFYKVHCERGTRLERFKCSQRGK